VTRELVSRCTSRFLSLVEASTFVGYRSVGSESVGGGMLCGDRKRQCSQPSGGPAGPRGGTAKSPGRDGTAICSPSGAA